MFSSLMADDIQSGCTEHLVLLVSQRLGRGNNDGVAGMNAHRVDIFHVADRDAVARAVPHYLVLDLFPAGDAALYEHLSHTGETESVLQDLHLHQLMGIVGDAAAASAEGISRTEHHRIADLIGKRQTVVHIFHDQGSRHRLSDLLHGGLELQTVLGLFDRLAGKPPPALRSSPW